MNYTELLLFPHIERNLVSWEKCSVPVEFIGSHSRTLTLAQKTVFNMSEKHISTVKWDRGRWQNKKGVMIRWHILNIVYKLLSIFEIWEHGCSVEMPLSDLPPVILPRQGSPVPQSCHLPPSSSPLCLSLRQEWNHIHLAQPRAGSENPVEGQVSWAQLCI